MTDPLIGALATPAQALVIGASSGIGLALVENLLARADVAQVFAVSHSVRAVRRPYSDCSSVDHADATAD